MLYVGLIEIAYRIGDGSYLNIRAIPIRAADATEALHLTDEWWHDNYTPVLRSLGFNTSADVFAEYSSVNIEVRTSVAPSMFPAWTSETHTADRTICPKYENTKGECE